MIVRCIWYFELAVFVVDRVAAALRRVNSRARST